MGVSSVKNRISQLSEQYGIKFIETEESYTSKASFLDNDLLPTFGEKPEGWQPSGKKCSKATYDYVKASYFDILPGYNAV